MASNILPFPRRDEDDIPERVRKEMEATAERMWRELRDERMGNVLPLRAGRDARGPGPDAA